MEDQSLAQSVWDCNILHLARRARGRSCACAGGGVVGEGVHPAHICASSGSAWALESRSFHCRPPPRPRQRGGAES